MEQWDTPWSCHASADLRILHTRGGNKFCRKITHTFNNKESDWGFCQYMSWVVVCDPDEGFIKDDSVTFEVKINADAPHGVKEQAATGSCNVNIPDIDDLVKYIEGSGGKVQGNKKKKKKKKKEALTSRIKEIEISHGDHGSSNVQNDIVKKENVADGLDAMGALGGFDTEFHKDEVNNVDATKNPNVEEVKTQDGAHDQICWNCHAEEDLKRCGGCETAWYCCKRCQLVDRKRHRKYCKRKIQERYNIGIIRLTLIPMQKSIELETEKAVEVE